MWFWGGVVCALLIAVIIQLDRIHDELIAIKTALHNRQ